MYTTPPLKRRRLSPSRSSSSQDELSELPLPTQRRSSQQLRLQPGSHETTKGHRKQDVHDFDYSQDAVDELGHESYPLKQRPHPTPLSPADSIPTDRTPMLATPTENTAQAETPTLDTHALGATTSHASPSLESDHASDVAAESSPALPAIPSSPQLEPPPTTLRYKSKLILRGHKRAVTSVKFSPDGTMIASCSADATLRIHSLPTGDHLHTLRGHIAGISTLAWSPTSTSLASGSDDKLIRLWTITTTSATPVLQVLAGHANYILTLAFSPKGNVLASGSADESVHLWDVRSRRILRVLPAHGDPVNGVDFSRDGTLVASCAADGLVRVWDAGSGQCLRTFFHEETPAVGGVKFAPNGRFVATWMLDGCVRLWDYVGKGGNDAASGRARCVKTYLGHRNERVSLVGAFGTYDVDCDGEDEGEEETKSERAFLASGSEDGSLVLWDVVSKMILQRVQGKHRHHGAVFGVDVHPERKMLVSCGEDRTVRVWGMD